MKIISIIIISITICACAIDLYLGKMSNALAEIATATAWGLVLGYNILLDRKNRYIDSIEDQFHQVNEINLKALASLKEMNSKINLLSQILHKELN